MSVFCSLSYPACEGHAPYYVVICGRSASNILFQVFHKQHDFRKKTLLDIIRVLIFITNFCETFLFPRQIGQVIIVNEHKSSFKVGLIVILVGF